MTVAEKQKAPEKQELPFLYNRVLKLLPHGSRRPITTSELSKLTGIDRDDVRYIISKLIVSYGVPIATSREGFYIITDEYERSKTVDNLRSRAESITVRYETIQNIDLENWKENIKEYTENIQNEQ